VILIAGVTLPNAMYLSRISCLMNTFIREKQTIRTGTTDMYKERRKL